MNKKYAVIGAGPAGLTAAYELTKAGIKVDVYEADKSVGGMAKTIKLWDQLVDLGPHRFFSSDARVNALWLELAGSDYVMIKRLTRIFYKETFFDYPLKPFNALNGLGIFESFFCLVSYISSKIFPPKDTSKFDGWVIKRFGKRLFDIFFKTYSEKLWGIKCNELDSDFAAQRIKNYHYMKLLNLHLLEIKTLIIKLLLMNLLTLKMELGKFIKLCLKKLLMVKIQFFITLQLKLFSRSVMKIQIQ